MKQIWPAPERNKEPILAVLRTVLPTSGRVLEIASGSGQHVAYFAAQLPGLVFLPSDPSEENRASIAAYVAELGLPNLEAPRAISVGDDDWGTGVVDAVFCANMIHIAPWEATLGLFGGSARVLGEGAPLVVYGPFVIDGEPIAESNRAFDEDLRRRDARWGVRDLGDVIRIAAEAGFAFESRVPMPANNQTVAFRRIR